MTELTDIHFGSFPRGFSEEYPPSWPMVRADSLVELRYGRALREAGRRAGPIPVYGTNGQCGWHDEPLATGPGVILGRKGMGNLGVEWCDGPYWVIDTAYYVHSKKEAIDLRFFYYLISYIGLNHLKDGTSNPSLSRQTFGAQLLPFPVIETQREIAATLAVLDHKIEQNRRTSAALERLARAIFRAWFVDYEPVKAKAAGATAFPSMPKAVFDALPTRLVDSELGPVPEGWSCVPLYSTARFVNGAAFKSSHFCEPSVGLPVAKIAELKNGLTDQTRYSARTDLDRKYCIDNGDILYSWSGSPDTSLDTFLWTKGRALLNQHIFRVLTETPAQKCFVYYLLKHLRQDLIEIARDKQTTGLGHVTVADMRRKHVCTPNEFGLEAFGNVAGALFELTFALMLESQRLQTVRDYLLPKLLSGAVRVREADQVVARATPAAERRIKRS